MKDSGTEAVAGVKDSGDCAVMGVKNPGIDKFNCPGFFTCLPDCFETFAGIFHAMAGILHTVAGIVHRPVARKSTPTPGIFDMESTGFLTHSSMALQKGLRMGSRS